VCIDFPGDWQEGDATVVLAFRPGALVFVKGENDPLFQSPWAEPDSQACCITSVRRLALAADLRKMALELLAASASFTDHEQFFNFWIQNNIILICRA